MADGISAGDPGFGVADFGGFDFGGGFGAGLGLYGDPFFGMGDFGSVSATFGMDRDSRQSLGFDLLGINKAKAIAEDVFASITTGKALTADTIGAGLKAPLGSLTLIPDVMAAAAGWLTGEKPVADYSDIIGPAERAVASLSSDIPSRGEVSGSGAGGGSGGGAGGSGGSGGEGGISLLSDPAVSPLLADSAPPPAPASTPAPAATPVVTTPAAPPAAPDAGAIATRTEAAATASADAARAAASEVARDVGLSKPTPAETGVSDLGGATLGGIDELLGDMGSMAGRFATGPLGLARTPVRIRRPMLS